MRYTVLSTFTPRAGVTVTLGALSFVLPAHVRQTADGIIASITDAFGSVVTATRTAGYTELAWTGTGTIDFGDPLLASYLGFAAQTVPHTQALSESPIRGHLDAEVSEPWGGRVRDTFRDVASIYGRLTASEEGRESTGSIGLWLRRRGDADSLATVMAYAYAVADAWVRDPIEVITQDGDRMLCSLTDGWEMAPELLDSETALVRLEVTRWE